MIFKVTTETRDGFQFCFHTKRDDSLFVSVFHVPEEMLIAVFLTCIEFDQHKVKLLIFVS